MNQDSDKGAKNGLLAVTTIVGGFIGAVVGLLLAPQSGRETRNNIQKSYDNLVDNVNNIVKKVDDTLPSFVDKVRTEVKDLPEQIKDEITHITKDTEDKLNKAIETGTNYALHVAENIKTTIKKGQKDG